MFLAGSWKWSVQYTPARVCICADHFHKPATYTTAVSDGADLIGFDSLMEHCIEIVAPYVVHDQALSTLC